MFYNKKQQILNLIKDIRIIRVQVYSKSISYTNGFENRYL